MNNLDENNNSKNTIIGVIILLLLVIVIVLVLYYFFKGLTFGVTKLIHIASKLDAVVIVALITGVLSLTSVISNSIITKMLEYRKNKREYLAQKREAPYKLYIKMVYKLAQNSKGEEYTLEQMTQDILGFSQELTLWGSKNVVKKWNNFRGMTLTLEKRESKDCIILMEDIMNEMRKDLGLKKTKKGELLGFFINDIDKLK